MTSGGSRTERLTSGPVGEVWWSFSDAASALDVLSERILPELYDEDGVEEYSRNVVNGTPCAARLATSDVTRGVCASIQNVR